MFVRDGIVLIIVDWLGFVLFGCSSFALCLIDFVGVCLMRVVCWWLDLMCLFIGGWLLLVV